MSTINRKIIELNRRAENLAREVQDLASGKTAKREKEGFTFSKYVEKNRRQFTKGERGYLDAIRKCVPVGVLTVTVSQATILKKSIWDSERSVRYAQESLKRRGEIEVVHRYNKKGKRCASEIHLKGYAEALRQIEEKFNVIKVSPESLNSDPQTPPSTTGKNGGVLPAKIAASYRSWDTQQQSDQQTPFHDHPVEPTGSQDQNPPSTPHPEIENIASRLQAISNHCATLDAIECQSTPIPFQREEWPILSWKGEKGVDDED